MERWQIISSILLLLSTFSLSPFSNVAGQNFSTNTMFLTRTLTQTSNYTIYYSKTSTNVGTATIKATINTRVGACYVTQVLFQPTEQIVHIEYFAEQPIMLYVLDSSGSRYWSSGNPCQPQYSVYKTPPSVRHSFDVNVYSDQEYTLIITTSDSSNPYVTLTLNPVLNDFLVTATTSIPVLVVTTGTITLTSIQTLEALFVQSHSGWIVVTALALVLVGLVAYHKLTPSKRRPRRKQGVRGKMTGELKA